MATLSSILRIEGDRTAECLAEVVGRLDSCRGEIVLDISEMRRIDSKVLKILEELASSAEARGLTIRLHGTNIDVYKVLKLTKLASRFNT
jgi:anti-anti-sigma regulatory factor